ncbi:MAG: IS200/IS605 family transposase [Armatimonadetes bacterium]|nr:IS200/IS605 family transposase [Armatimonadota bacterium]
MPSTYASLHVHVVYSTKGRHPSFHPDVIDEVHRYLGGTVNGLGAQSVIVGGVADHVHLLFGMRTTQSVSDLVREVKKASSHWMRERQRDFAWQEGYGAFSVSPERLGGVKKYIENQAEHHQKKSFREEFIELLRYAGIEFDEALLD